MRIFWLYLSLLLAFNAHSFSWSDLWATKDQQGQALMKQQQFKEAVTAFENKNWQATAAYRAGDYQQAAKRFEALNNEDGFFNQGNALAKMKAYDKAIKAYDKALAINPNNEDALFNKKLIEDLLKNQPQNNQQNDKKDKQDKSEQQDDQKNNQNNDQQKQGDQKKQEEKDQQSSPSKSDQSEDKEQQSKPEKDEKQKQENQPDKTKPEEDKQQEESQNSPDKPEEKKPEPAKEESSAEEREQQRAKDQWLRLIPDDPGGLLREKFLRDHIRRQGGWYQ